MYPDELKYTAEHEWLSADDAHADGDGLRVGITDYAQQALGDIVYVSLPEVGDDVDAGAVLGELESTKSVSEIYAPISGTVVARNDSLYETPELINSDPYGDGWILQIQPSDPDQLGTLLDAASYRATLDNS